MYYFLNKISKNPFLKIRTLALVGLLLIPVAFTAILASPNVWSYVSSTQVQNTLQENRAKEAKLAQEKKQKQEQERIEKEKKAQEQARIEKEKIEEEKRKAEQESKKQQIANQEISIKAIDEVTSQGTNQKQKEIKTQNSSHSSKITITSSSRKFYLNFTSYASTTVATKLSSILSRYLSARYWC
jgi:outer membrane biosynthesis protein TonB